MSSDVGLGGARERATKEVAVTWPPATPLSAERRRIAPTPPERPRWEARYARAVAANDLAALAVAVAVGHLLGLGNFNLMLGGKISPGLGIGIAALAVVCLLVVRTWDPKILGYGSEEFSRLLRGYVTCAVALSLIGLAAQVTALRPWVFGLLPLAFIQSVVARFVLRKALHRRRAAGRCMHPLLVVGTVESIADIIRRTRRDTSNGWVVTGACTPTGRGPNGEPQLLDVPVLGDLDAVAEVVRRGEHSVVSVGSTPGWSPNRLHQLAWDLEGLGADLVVDPRLMEIAGPRLHVAPVDGLPLLRLTHPAFSGVPRVVKTVLDRMGAAALLFLALPVFLIIAVAVKLDGGPVFFRQDRVGRHGRHFRMLKFRSMVVDAESRREDLLAANEGAGPLFKLRDDPRVTTVGSLLRRYSLDELPQLINVLVGSMSLVGPRPPLPDEVRCYTRDAERKLEVKPGLTGLWQVSGRSDLSWDESLRLDLRYVENWSLAMDALILWKTFGAIVRGHGAY